MIVRFGGGNSGIAEYLEKGAKHDRHYSRDELDNRIIIDGDLEITDKIINDITDKGQDRYLHITMSFNETDITIEKMQAAYEDYKSQFLTAYKDGEINTYAEIHWPKTQQLLDKSTNEMYDRFPHIHIVIPKQNLLTGGYTNPVGYHLKNVNIWDAIQEDVNNKHGLKSPTHSPRVSLENYKTVLDRHKIKEFNPKHKATEVKRELFDTIEKQGVKNWQDFKDLVSSHGEIKIRNEGKATEYYAVKLPDNSKFTNLNNPIFSKEYIEKREIPHQPLTQYQIDNRLKQWEVVSKEIKYIDDASAAAKRAYRALNDEQKVSFLKKHETNFYEEYDEKELSESKHKPNTFRSGYSKFDRGGEAERRSLHDLPSLALVHSGATGSTLTRVELLLPSNEISDIQLTEADSDAGLQRPVHTSTRVISDKEQIKSLSSQIIFDIEESTAIEKANDLQLFKEIRTNLDPDLVLAYAQANHLINPEEHKHFNAKDGSARISFGKFNYNVSDFFTKGLGLEWKETEVILKSLYEAQTSGVKVEPVSNVILKECFIDFEERIYSVKLEQFKRVTNSIDKDESLSIKQINARYFTENRRISKLEFTTWSERENLKSINAFEKLVAEEQLKAIMFGNRQNANAIKYPFSDHFEKYLTQQKVIDMSLINDLKEKYAKPKETENELENSIGGKGFDFVLNGKEAARRAKLTADLARQGQPNTRYGYSFKELTPDQQKDSVVFSHGGKKLFETKANRTKVLGALDFDKTATALVYSMQRYGNPLDIKGTEKFREQIIEVAARNELKVEFTDPALNEALKVRLAELELEAANENSISAQDLELDKSLGERAAVDKAMLESKHREIEADLQQPNQAAVDLAAIAITQRLNAHEHEPVTAETAQLDTAVYNELKQTPALQAYFAVEMSKIGAANAEYRAEFIKNEPEEFMLANHAARKFTDELETAYQANKPQEELDLTLDEAVFKEQTEALDAILEEESDNRTVKEIVDDLEATAAETLKNATTEELQEMAEFGAPFEKLEAEREATNQPEELSLSALYAAELILHEDKRTDFGTATDTTALDAWDVSSKQYELLTARIAERLESGEIPSDLQSQAEPDYLDAAKDIVLATDFKTIDSEALKTLTGEDFERPNFESIQPEQWQPEAPVIEPEAIDKDVEKELHATPAFGTDALDEPLELDPAAPTFEPATDGTNELTQPEKIAAEYQDLFMKHGSIDHFDGVQTKNMVIELESRHEILMQDIGALPENASTIQTLEAIKALEKNEALAYAVAVAGSDDKSIQLRDTIAGDLHSFKGALSDDMRQAVNDLDHASKGERNLTQLAVELAALRDADANSHEANSIKATDTSLKLKAFENDLSSQEKSALNEMNKNYEQVAQEVKKYQDIFVSAYMKDGYNDMVKGSISEESKDSPRYVDEAQKGALAQVVEQFKYSDLTPNEKSGKVLNVSLSDFQADIQERVNQTLEANGLPKFDIASYNKYENEAEIDTLESFKIEPAPLSAENAGDKHIANQISDLKAPASAEEAEATAATLSNAMHELRGKPELRQAAMAAVVLIDKSPMLQDSMAEIAEYDDFTPVVLETTREMVQSMEMAQSAPDVDMEM